MSTRLKDMISKAKKIKKDYLCNQYQSGSQAKCDDSGAKQKARKESPPMSDEEADEEDKNPLAKAKEWLSKSHKKTCPSCTHVDKHGRGSHVTSMGGGHMHVRFCGTKKNTIYGKNEMDLFKKRFKKIGKKSLKKHATMGGSPYGMSNG